MTILLLEPRVALIMNFALLLLLIPIVLIFKGNMYALIIGIALPSIHYAYLMFNSLRD